MAFPNTLNKCRACCHPDWTKLRFRVCYLQVANAGRSHNICRQALKGSCEDSSPTPRQMGVSAPLKHPLGRLDWSISPKWDACVFWVALLLRASGYVVINSMIDDFNASRMGCPERRNRTENVYLPIAWNRAHEVATRFVLLPCLGGNFSTMGLWRTWGGDDLLGEAS